MAQVKTNVKVEDDGMAEYIVYDNDGTADSDEDEDGAGYFVDQAGNYYYRQHKNATPVPADPPIEEEGGEDDEMVEALENEGVEKDEDGEMQLVFVMNDDNKGIMIKVCKCN